MVAANRSKGKHRPCVSWRLFVNGRLALGGNSLETLAKCAAYERVRNRIARFDRKQRARKPPTILIDSFDDFCDRLEDPQKH